MRPERCRECGLAGAGYTPPRFATSLPESDKSQGAWGGFPHLQEESVTNQKTLDSTVGSPPQQGSDVDVQHQAADSRARDILSVKDALVRMNADPDGAFLGSSDLSKLFAAGHSLGGMAAFRACQLEPSILGCINIDGGYRARPYPATVNASVIEPAFLWLRRPLYEFTDTQLKQVGLSRSEFDEEIAMGRRVMRSVGGGGFDVRLPHAGIDHMDFSDVPLLQKDIPPSSRATRSLTIEMMRSWVRDFLEASVAGEPRRVLTQTSAAYREARISAYK